MWAALIPIAIGAISGAMKGKANQAQARSDADALRKNAVFLDRAAADARRRGAHESDLQRIRGEQAIGTQRAGMAAGGGRVDEGTNAIITQDTAQLSELDALTISNNAAREAWGYSVEAADKRDTAKALVKNAKKSMMSSVIGGAISGATSAYTGGQLGGLFGGGGGSVNLQGQAAPLTNNAAFIKNY